MNYAKFRELVINFINDMEYDKQKQSALICISEGLTTEQTDYGCYISYKRNFLPDGDHVIWWIVTGGSSGGNCWGDSAEPYSTNEVFPETNLLDRIIIHFADDNFSFIRYKKLINDHVKETSSTDYEYYGNCTEYRFRYINLKEVYKALYA